MSIHQIKSKTGDNKRVYFSVSTVLCGKAGLAVTYNAEHNFPR